jgi:hypothetical protein
MRAARVALSLLVVLAAAKGLTLDAIGVRVTPASLPAFFWQDAAVTIAALVLARVVQSAWVVWPAYGLAVVFVAIDVPLAVVVGSPLTWPMMQAARGALADSIRYAATSANVGRLLSVIAIGAMAPVAFARIRSRTPLVVACGLIGAVVVAGPVVSGRVDTIGLDRNAITALLPRARPGPAGGPVADWRASPVSGGAIGPPAAVDLTRYRAAARGFNVVLIVLESTAAQYLKPFGAAEDPMPELTALARHAIVFEDAYAAYPESVKGLYATLCGRHPLFGVDAAAHAARPCASIARSLHEAGYRTALFHSGRFGYLGMDALLQRTAFDRLEDAGTIGGHVESSFGVDEAATVDRMLAWIDAGRSAAPFFLAYLPVAGHHPYATTRPGPFAATSDMGRYRNALHEADEALAALLDGLRTRRLDRTTLIVVTGDHGEAFGQHPGNSGHTLFVYEENVHVPLIVVVPGATTAAVEVPRVASLVDVPATIRDLTGLARQPDDEGVSLLASGSRLALFFTDYAVGRIGLRDGCWKALLDIEANRLTLFDLCRDPGETRDLSGAAPRRAAAYGAHLAAWAGRR